MTCGISMLMGGGGARITLNANYDVSSTVGAGTATCQFELTNGGDIRLTNPNNSVNDVGDWISPKAGFANYEAMLTVDSGSSPTGAALATWLSLATTRNWQLAQAVVGINSSSTTLQIRNATTLVVLGTSTLTWAAERT